MKYTIQLTASLEECIAAKIKNLRKQAGWTQEELADKLTIKRSTLSNIEKGRYFMTVKTLEELCALFNLKSSGILPF